MVAPLSVTPLESSSRKLPPFGSEFHARVDDDLAAGEIMDFVTRLDELPSADLQVLSVPTLRRSLARTSVSNSL